jgi:uroporphyrin-III C-methyltransferase
VAGRQAVAEADVVVYDRLVNPCLLELARHNAEIVYAGKRAGEDGPLSQEEINELLCAEARAGRVVVRLKGGDPFVFGRGGEEALAAARAGIPFTVIPGVTAATAVPAFAGIPVTHRGVASAFTVVTGQSGQGTDSIDWEALARIGGTLVLLMGVETLPEISARLIRAGLPAETPAAVVQEGTTPGQLVVLGTLNDIAERARDAGLGAPATAVIGQVAALAQELAWYTGAMSRPTRTVDDPEP